MAKNLTTPSFQHLGFNTVDASFLSYWVRRPKFGFHWHYHPEFEISYVKNGFGNRMIGDSVEEFTAGDLLLIGGDLPHTLISSEWLETGMEVVVIQFPAGLFETKSLEIIELSPIKKLLEDSSRGLSFPPQLVESIGPKLEQLPSQSGFHQYHSFLAILHEMSQSEYHKLASVAYKPSKSHDSEARIGTVCLYIHDHFTEAITLDDLSSIANMSKAAFCRFFKKMTGKTAIEYLNDLRVGKACQLILENKPVSQVAFDAGFNSLTHFHRCFITRKKLSPLAYRKQFNNDAPTN